MVAATTTTGMLSQHVESEPMSVVRRTSQSVTKGSDMMLRDRREYFIRTASLDRLRQFPAYLCTRGSIAFPNVLLFLNGALIAVQSAIKNLVQVLHRNSLFIAIVAALILLLAEIIICISIFIIGSKPPGLFFMLASLFLMAAIAHTSLSCGCSRKRKSRRN